ncbi:hypothetical protein BJ170DRAFT_16827 [Xylariales sp. AK1849]|nr:hypothetical protein BJ170DRAFT_16827 [Xylariales sp. AK1849]
MAAAAKKMPILLFTAQVVEGHTGPMLQIAEAMVKRGYEAVFVSAREFETKIQRLGAEYVATPGAFEMASPTFLEERAKLPPGPAKVTFEQEVIFFQPMARRTQIIQETLEKLRERTPDQQVIIVEEAASMSVYPFKYGRPLPNGFAEFPKTICINVIPLWLQSVDTGPFMLGLPQDSTESGRLRNQALNQLMLVGPLMQMVEMQKKYMREAGATSFPSADRMPLDGWITSMGKQYQELFPTPSG